MNQEPWSVGPTGGLRRQPGCGESFLAEELSPSFLIGSGFRKCRPAVGQFLTRKLPVFSHLPMGFLKNSAGCGCIHVLPHFQYNQKIHGREGKEDEFWLAKIMAPEAAA